MNVIATIVQANGRAPPRLSAICSEASLHAIGRLGLEISIRQSWIAGSGIVRSTNACERSNSFPSASNPRLSDSTAANRV